MLVLAVTLLCSVTQTTGSLLLGPLEERIGQDSPGGPAYLWGLSVLPCHRKSSCCLDAGEGMAGGGAGGVTCLDVGVGRRSDSYDTSLWAAGCIALTWAAASEGARQTGGREGNRHLMSN